MNKNIQQIYMDEQYYHIDDAYTDEIYIYSNICEQCRCKASGYDDTSTVPAKFYCNSCWMEFNASMDLINQIVKKQDSNKKTVDKLVDENAAMEYLSNFDNRCKKKKHHHIVNYSANFTKEKKGSKKKNRKSSALDRDKMEVIVQQYYRLNHNNWNHKLKCLIDGNTLRQYKDEYEEKEEDGINLYLIYTHDPIICKFNWYSHTLLISGFCNDHTIFIPDVVTIMVWKYYCGYTGFDIKQCNHLDAKIRIERKLANIDYGYKPKWYEKEMIIALLYDNNIMDNINNNRKRRKKSKWPRHIEMRHIVPLYKMINDYH